jgi:hypothetical protein
MTKYTHNLRTVTEAFDRDLLGDVCVMPEEEFGEAYGLTRVNIPERDPRFNDHFYFFGDYGSRVLAVAHLDTVADADARVARFIHTEAGEVVFSRALDDRLGAYTILELLPEVGIEYDILLTVGEEMGSSTAEFFDAPEGRTYDWIIEFDRGGTDVVLYQYEDATTIAATRATGAHVAQGIFSDISYMEHVGVKAWNWGVGYRDYHGPKSHAYLDDYFSMIARYLKFHQQNYGVNSYPHDIEEADPWYGRARGRNSYSSSRSSSAWSWDDDEYAVTHKEKDYDLEDDGWYFHAERGWVQREDVDWYYDDNGVPGYFDEDDMWHALEDDPRASYSEPVYFDQDYNEDPTMEEIQAALEKMDEERLRYSDLYAADEAARAAEEAVG